MESFLFRGGVGEDVDDELSSFISRNVQEVRMNIELYLKNAATFHSKSTLSFFDYVGQSI